MSDPTPANVLATKIREALPFAAQSPDAERNIVVALGARGNLPFNYAAAVVALEPQSAPDIIKVAVLLPTGMSWCEMQIGDPTRSLVHFVPYSRVSRVVEESFTGGYALAIELDADVRTQDSYAPGENGIAITRDRPAAVIFNLTHRGHISDAQVFVMQLRNYMR